LAFPGTPGFSHAAQRQPVTRHASRHAAERANVYFDLNPIVPGTEQLRRRAALDCSPVRRATHIDALVVFDNGDGVYHAGIDQVMFSLTQESAVAAGGQFSPADISHPDQWRHHACWPPLPALDWPTDNVDAIEIKVTNNAETLRHCDLQEDPGRLQRR
jgi:hypothetical protein